MYQLCPVSAFQDNYIWMLQHPSHPGLAVAVDPGQSAPVQSWLAQHQLKLAAILITHHHPDHTGGVRELAATDLPVYGPVNSPFDDINHPLHEGDQIELLGQKLYIKEVPAHTLDHIAYYTTADDRDAGDTAQLFCGDTLFVGGCGRLFEGSAEQMQQAMAFFRSLPDNTQICCAHEYTLANLAFATAVEPDNQALQAALARCQQLRAEARPTVPGSIGEEKQINPFMRYDQPGVISAAQRSSGQTVRGDARILAAIRLWKDRF
jgi:hydroxyacylglutathione hydrolase